MSLLTRKLVSVLFLLSCLALVDSVSAAKQDQRRIPRTVMTESSRFDVQHLRLQLDIFPDKEQIHGQLRIQVRYRTRDVVNTDDRIRIFIPNRGLSITEAAFVSGPDAEREELAAVRTGEYFELITDTDSSSITIRDNQTFLVHLQFELSDGVNSFPLGADRGPWKSVRSRDLFEKKQWLPFPIDIHDQFSAEFRIGAPSEWAIYLPGTSGPAVNTSDQNVFFAYFDSTSDTRDLAFVAVDGTDTELRVISTESDSSFAQDIQDVTDFMRHYGGHADGTFITVDSITHSTADRVAGVRTIPAYLVSPRQLEIAALARDLFLIPDPTEIDLEHPSQPTITVAMLGAVDWVNSNLRFTESAGRWLYPALSAFLSAEYIRGAHGKSAFEKRMWEFRNLYFGSENGAEIVLDTEKQPSVIEESASGASSSETLRYHADQIVRARGVWVLRMLADRIGRDKFALALSNIATRSRDQPVSSEDFRFFLEDVSTGSLRSFFKTWVYGPGHPIIEYSYSVRASQDAISLVVSQDSGLYDATAYYEVDTQIQILSLGGVDSVMVQLRGPLEELTVPVALRPQFVLFDPSSQILYEPATPLTTELLISGLRRSTGETGQLAMLHQLLKRHIEPAHLLGLRSILNGPLSVPVRAMVLEVLGSAAPSAAAARDLVTAAGSDYPVVHAAALRGLARFSELSEARTLALSAANSSQNPLVLAAAVESLVSLDSTLALAVLQSAMVTESENDFVRREAVKTLMRSGVSLKEKWKFVQPLLSDENHPETRMTALVSSGIFMSDPEKRKEISGRWPYLAAAERRVVLSHFRTTIPPTDLTEDEVEQLRSWLLSEPETDTRTMLQEYIPIR